MRTLRAWLYRVYGWLARDRHERDLSVELESHISLHVDEGLRAGLAPDEARRAALLALGGVGIAKEAVRNRRGLPLVETLGHDVRYAVRQLRRSPGFTTVAFLTLAAGIGGNAAIFSVVDAVILRPLSYRDAERLVAVHEWIPDVGSIPVNGLHFTEWRKRAESFEALALIGQDRFNLTGSGEPEHLAGARVSSGLFSVLGVPLWLGRHFLEEEDAPGRDRVVIISHALWQRRFAADPDIVGRAVALDGIGHEIVGVLPPDFQFPRLSELFPLVTRADRPEIWKPLALQDAELIPAGAFNFTSIARLKAGRSMTQARSELDAITATVARQVRDLDGIRTEVLPLHEQITGRSRTGLSVLLLAVGLVLVIGCANIANLLLARVSARDRELATRAAVGASRTRLARQLIVESLVLSAFGGAGAIAIAYAAVHVIVASAPADIARLGEVHVSGRVLGFTLVVATMTGLLISILPAWQYSGRSDPGGLATGTRATAGRRHLGSVLITGEVALSLVCLVAGGLLLSSFVRLLAVERGFEAENVLTVDLSLDGPRYPDAQARATFIRTVLDQVGALPGVLAAGISNRLPLTTVSNSALRVEGAPDVPLLERPLASLCAVNAGYFDAMGIELQSGQAFDDRSRNDRLIAIVSRSTAERAWPRMDPIGKRFRTGAGDTPWIEVVGVAAEVKSDGLDRPPPLTVYVPYWQRTPTTVALAVKTEHGAAPAASAVRAIVRDLDPDLPLSSIRAMDDLVDDSLAQRRFQTLLVLLFGVAAMFLAGLGVYGVVSYAVLQRTSEIGIRLALGARRRAVRWRVISDALRMVAVGLAAGVPLAIAAGFGLRTLLFDVAPHDVTTLAGACLVLTAASAAAAYLPARRASCVQPMTALRCD